MNDNQEKLQRPIDLLRQKLAKDNIAEFILIRWLKTRGAIPKGTPGLQCISPKRILLILDLWNEVRDQLRSKET
jgi:hypothetical protein